ncbi:MAG TPA: metal-dependent transcriptional regulator [Cryomorphaceae bacterium]|nr:metal-dependent transcriptional regulator [Cryomorphaceae bacterium]
MPSPTEENYLKAIYNLADDRSEVSLSELGNVLGVSTPTVNSMAKRLDEQGYVLYRKYKPLKLTESGKIIAAQIIRKHRLTEMYLVEHMGFGWEEVHDIAEQMEHVQSPALFERMDEIMGYPTIDPHGSPIPDKHGKVAFQEYLKLSEIEVGKTVKLCALTHSSDDFLVFLNGKGLKLGTLMTVLHRESFDRSMTISYDGRETMVSHDVSDRLLVEKA